MKHLTLENGKLFTEARVKTDGEYETFYVMIDTALPNTVLNKHKVTVSDLDAMSIGPLKVSNFQAELQELDIDGIIGLDFLLKTGAKLNFDAMTISSSRT
ncbi:hypothetical protein [Alkalicoccus daliensis]|uniref:Uncharacterized protein n=1 Tax=Alkalicoccus daliensis TaxID=745820 RepID=A0A1H0AI68_9BACI|nr:hypothetical protein [Alkalicoccus daliensis]SDN33105.1 hypothetical protein SAMN04488053_101493 [Alkalicoccus daliensis]